MLVTRSAEDHKIHLSKKFSTCLQDFNRPSINLEGLIQLHRVMWRSDRLVVKSDVVDVVKLLLKSVEVVGEPVGSQ